MARYQHNGASKVVYDDPVTGKQRSFLPGETFWAQPTGAINLNPSPLVVLDPNDHYGSLTRRQFVEQSDLDTDGANYVAGSKDQIKILDEFVGVGQGESLSGKIFKRTIFKYQDANRPTVWTSIFETTLVEA